MLVRMVGVLAGLYLGLAILMAFTLPTFRNNDCNICNGNSCTLMLCRGHTLPEVVQRGEFKGKYIYETLLMPAGLVVVIVRSFVHI